MYLFPILTRNLQSSSVGQTAQQPRAMETTNVTRRSRDVESVLAGPRKSLDMNQLMENDIAEVFYCNTVSQDQDQGMGNTPQGTVEGAEESLYVNVKH